MGLILIVETSSRFTSVAIRDGDNLLFRSESVTNTSCSLELLDCINYGLKFSDTHISSIDFIAVDIGPGGLNSVRSGVSFVNGLAFAIRKPIYPFFSFELIGFEAWKSFNLPVLCIAKASNKNIYAGLYIKNSLASIRFGSFEYIVEELTSSLDIFAVAGEYREEVKSKSYATGKACGAKIVDSGIHGCKAEMFMSEGYPDLVANRFSCSSVAPLNEESSIFYE